MKKPALLDLNILIALAWPSHIHHTRAHQWFAKEHTHGWATCPITQTGFTRLSSNPKILADSVSPVEAIRLLVKITALPHHLFWEDSISLSQSIVFRQGKMVGYRQITDAYLLSLAIHNNGHLVTYDKGIASLIPDSHKDSLTILDDNL